MSEQANIAIITGGASGIGLATAEALFPRNNWIVYLLDRDAERGETAADKTGAYFIRVDVTDYASLAAAFGRVFKEHGKINFVFANAGIALEAPPETPKELSNEPPAAPSMKMLSVNLQSVMFTTHLAQHYFRQSPAASGPRCIVVTASSASLYASAIAPAYAASKHGVLGWTRSIAPDAWKQDQVRVNAILPGIVRTNILPPEMFAMFPEQMLTPVDKVVEVVLLLLDGDGDEKAGRELRSGQAVEICGTNHYVRNQQEYCDPVMAAIMGVGA
ncbi:hypothetical protein LTR78_006007 [Recurvomyces mirabilis]|uniref:NAD(P)-binding protein n=1 Tax=Recurvomyces mirabilis TaxID=574656 RepID=A0AAE0WM29_9PEZI|nr:hypothetical protein LTR78_006007 [Recurvomyces mirabilis]KAK5155183.1 hypothetical protein LTS14_006138 [Recurvomyces mirabilis]